MAKKVVHRSKKCPYQYWSSGSRPSYTTKRSEVTCKWCKDKQEEHYGACPVCENHEGLMGGCGKTEGKMGCQHCGFMVDVDIWDKIPRKKKQKSLRTLIREFSPEVYAEYRDAKKRLADYSKAR